MQSVQLFPKMKSYGTRIPAWGSDDILKKRNYLRLIESLVQLLTDCTSIITIENDTNIGPPGRTHEIPS